MIFIVNKFSVLDVSNGGDLSLSEAIATFASSSYFTLFYKSQYDPLSTKILYKSGDSVYVKYQLSTAYLGNIIGYSDDNLLFECNPVWNYYDLKRGLKRILYTVDTVEVAIK